MRPTFASTSSTRGTTASYPDFSASVEPRHEHVVVAARASARSASSSARATRRTAAAAPTDTAPTPSGSTRPPAPPSAGAPPPRAPRSPRAVARATPAPRRQPGAVEPRRGVDLRRARRAARARRAHEVVGGDRAEAELASTYARKTAIERLRARRLLDRAQKQVALLVRDLARSTSSGSMPSSCVRSRVSSGCAAKRVERLVELAPPERRVQRARLGAVERLHDAPLGVHREAFVEPEVLGRSRSSRGCRSTSARARARPRSRASDRRRAASA